MSFIFKENANEIILSRKITKILNYMGNYIHGFMLVYIHTLTFVSVFRRKNTKYIQKHFRMRHMF